VKSFVEPGGGQSAEPFHISAALEYRWDSLQTRDVSQVVLAEKLEVRQPTISKIERREDMNLSTLRGYVRARGGELQVTARFPHSTVEWRSEPTRAAQARGAGRFVAIE
jgi:predicted XRE-type DNA-binding protein